jgi:hypothetical protein
MHWAALDAGGGYTYFDPQTGHEFSAVLGFTPRETDCRIIGSAEPFGPRRRPVSTSVFWTETMIELPEVRECGMSGRIEQ